MFNCLLVSASFPGSSGKIDHTSWLVTSLLCVKSMEYGWFSTGTIELAIHGDLAFRQTTTQHNDQIKTQVTIVGKFAPFDK